MLYKQTKMLQMAKHRGYTTERAVVQAIAKLIGVTYGTAKGRFRTGYFSFEESAVIASFFEMTPKEYCDVFLNGLFVVNREGHYVAYVEDPGRLVRLRTEKRRQADAKVEARKRAREELAKQVEEDF